VHCQTTRKMVTIGLPYACLSSVPVDGLTAWGTVTYLDGPITGRVVWKSLDRLLAQKVSFIVIATKLPGSMAIQWLRQMEWALRERRVMSILCTGEAVDKREARRSYVVDCSFDLACTCFSFYSAAVLMEEWRLAWNDASDFVSEIKKEFCERRWLSLSPRVSRMHSIAREKKRA